VVHQHIQTPKPTLEISQTTAQALGIGNIAHDRVALRRRDSQVVTQLAEERLASRQTHNDRAPLCEVGSDLSTDTRRRARDNRDCTVVTLHNALPWLYKLATKVLSHVPSVASRGSPLQVLVSGQPTAANLDDTPAPAYRRP